MIGRVRRTGVYQGYRRRGSGYLLILGAAMLISVIGLSSLTLVRIQWRSEKAAIDSGRARLYARSAIESAVAYTIADPDWRSNYQTLASYMPMPLGGGYCSMTITEPGGSALVTTWDEPVLLTGMGLIGSAATPQAVAWTCVQAHHPPLDLLRTPLHSAGDINVDGALLTVGQGPISTNGYLTNTGGIDGDVEAGAVYNWGSINGVVTTSAPAKQMPAATTWDYYRGLPTVVALPASTVGANLEWVVVSPQVNPWQPANTSADGLYYINPTGDLHVRDCRISGTMLIDLPAGKKLVIEHGVLWAPARPEFPSLIVRAPCEIKITSMLSESGLANFNPPAAPYEGQSDSDQIDSYSSLLKGIFHVIGSTSTVLIDNQTTMKGVLIADGPVTIKNTINLQGDPNLSLISPIKYRKSYLELDTGTWQPIVSGRN